MQGGSHVAHIINLKHQSR